MIKKSVVVCALFLTGVFAASNARSHPTSSVTATATANVVEDISIASEEPLNFGFITPSPRGGTVTVSPDNTRSATGGVTASSAFTHASFSVHGIAGHNYTIHAPSSLTFSLKEQDDGEESKPLIRELTVTDFVTYSTTAGTKGESGKLAQDGQDKIYLGATLVVPPATAPGVYSGWVPLTVSY